MTKLGFSNSKFREKYTAVILFATHHTTWWCCRNGKNIVLIIDLISCLFYRIFFRGDTLSLQTRAVPPTIYQIHAVPPTILGLPSSVPVLLVCPGQISIQNRAFVRRPSLYLVWIAHYESQWGSISSKSFLIFLCLRIKLNPSPSIHWMYSAVV